MNQTQLLNEFRQFSLSQQLEIIQEALQILSLDIQGSKPRLNGDQTQKSLAEAANLLLADYLKDPELTSFTNQSNREVKQLCPTFSESTFPPPAQRRW